RGRASVLYRQQCWTVRAPRARRPVRHDSLRGPAPVRLPGPVDGRDRGPEPSQRHDVGVRRQRRIPRSPFRSDRIRRQLLHAQVEQRHARAIQRAPLRRDRELRDGLMKSRKAALLVYLLSAIPARLIAQSALAPPAVADYVIGPQDVLTIQVFDQADLGGKYTVEADGTFSFSLIGRVLAGGLTLRAFETELRKQLADGYFKNPQVTVAVETYRSQRVFVMGEVRQPGPVPLTGGMTLIEALARAGSTLSTASGDVAIVRAPKAAK